MTISPALLGKAVDYARLSDSMAMLAGYWLELNISPPSNNRVD